MFPVISGPGQAIGGLRQWVTLPERRIPLDEVPSSLPYQLSAFFRSTSLDSTGIGWVRAKWYDDTGSLGEDLSVECEDCTGTVDWHEITASGYAPPEATRAQVEIGVSGRSGALVVDDVDLRLDGPYALPWLTSGWNGLEVTTAEVTDQILAAYTGGAQGFHWYEYYGFDGGDEAAFAAALRKVVPYEDIVMHGRPVPAPGLYLDDYFLPGPDRVPGLERDDRLLISVSSYEPVAVDRDVAVRQRVGTVYEVDEDGTLIAPGETIDGSDFTFTVSFEPTDEGRTRLFLCECEPL